MLQEKKQPIYPHPHSASATALDTSLHSPVPSIRRHESLLPQNIDRPLLSAHPSPDSAPLSAVSKPTNASATPSPDALLEAGVRYLGNKYRSKPACEPRQTMLPIPRETRNGKQKRLERMRLPLLRPHPQQVPTGASQRRLSRITLTIRSTSPSLTIGPLGRHRPRLNSDSLTPLV